MMPISSSAMVLCVPRTYVNANVQHNAARLDNLHGGYLGATVTRHLVRLRRTMCVASTRWLNLFHRFRYPPKVVASFYSKVSWRSETGGFVVGSRLEVY
jgi:hypothetical protein